MLDFIYHMTIKLVKVSKGAKRIFGVKMLRLCHIFRNIRMDVTTLHTYL